MYNFFKRLLDIIISLFSLIILLPIFIPIIIILRLSGEGEVFYFQERYGIHNSRFQIWKFATMLKNSMNIGTGSITLQSDPRVTKIGFFLRKTKINELPQIINILKGDISLVGPRPLVTKTFTAYNKEVQSKIYNVKPGLTGIGSIIFRDEESIISAVTDEDPHEFYKRIIAPYKGELEMWYQSNKHARILSIPKGLITKMAQIGGILHLPLNRERLQKLTESYVVSNTKIVSAIGKSLPVDSKEAMLRTFGSFNR